jgi:hypothetical protein
MKASSILAAAGAALICTSVPPAAQAGPYTRLVRAKANKTVSVRGSISRGSKIPLGWASTSQMACWPSIRNQYFDGKHVLFMTRIPRRSIMKIELIPRGNADLSLYAYTGGGGARPPRVTRAVSCEAAFLTGIKRRSVTRNPGGVERVRLNAVNNPYNVIIGVAGAHGATRGDFELRVTLVSGGPGVKDTGPPPLKMLRVAPNTTKRIRGSINRGKRIPLRWASTSSMACWPSVRNQHFDGHHVLYKTRLPRRSVMNIKLKPKGRKDLSLYAYSGSNPYLPPKVRRAVSCEASYLHGIKRRSITTNPGGVEKVRLNAINNPYDVIIGVAGAHKLTRADFELEVKLVSAGPGVADTGPPPLKNVAVAPNSVKTISGSINGGKIIPLRWASTSSMACWPSNKNVHANGNHVLYKTRLPPRSTMDIELLPGSRDDLTLYAYSGSNPYLPPKVRRAVSCEASYLYGIRSYSVKSNPGGKEKVQLRSIRNPYDVIIGVAGANKAKTGRFKLKITLKTAGGGVADTGPPPLKKLAVAPNTTKRISGSINGGKRIPLRWASYSSMACWPGNKNVHFNGKHVLYKTRLPARSVMTVKLKPGARKDLSLYAYSASNPNLPPRVQRAVSCEASYLYGIKRYSVKSNPGGIEKVRLNAIRNPYDVIIGVAGANKLDRGDFQLEVKLVTAGPGVADTGPPPLRRVSSRSGRTVQVSGRIDGGKRLPLRWASTSSMACWPSIRDHHFNGKHVAYLTTIPAQHDMTIELLPGSGKDLSLYAYTVGTQGNVRLPPRVPSAITCEASFLYGNNRRSVRTNPGGREKVKLNATTRPLRVVIGVAGAHGLTRGSFRLRIKAKPKR